MSAADPLCLLGPDGREALAAYRTAYAAWLAAPKGEWAEAQRVLVDAALVFAQRADFVFTVHERLSFERAAYRERFAAEHGADALAKTGELATALDERPTLRAIEGGKR